MTKVAVVTGANKGIGFGIVRGLCKEFQGEVILTARDVGRGEAAVAELKKEGLGPKFHQLDILDKDSISRLAGHLKDSYGGLDVLVNNAGIAYKEASTAPFAEQAEVTVRTNFCATLDVCDQLFPLLRRGARVVHVSSRTGPWAWSKLAPELKSRLGSCKTVGDVQGYMKQFLHDVKDDTLEEKGWPKNSYSVSKLGVNLVTPIQQAFLDTIQTDAVVNSCCPGYVSTDMSSFKGSLTIDEGALTPVYLALLPPNADIRGQHLKKKSIVSWR